MRRAGWVLVKDLRLGPTSPLLLWGLILPLLLTLLVRGVFGDLLDAAPTLLLVDEGAPQTAAALTAAGAVDVRTAPDAEEVRAAVADGTIDAGLVLPAGFDDALVGRQQPPLDVVLAGASLPSARTVVLAAVLEALREVSGQTVDVAVDVVTVGEETVPLDVRLLPLLVMYAVTIPGAMIPAFGLVEEKERGTAGALLVAPLSVRELLLAKGTLGVLLAGIASLLTLMLNDAWGAAPAALALALTLGAVMLALLGLLAGVWASDANTLFALWKAVGVLLFLPVVFFLFPDLPRWPATVMPAYYFLAPTYAVTVEGAGLADVAPTLAGALLICAGLLAVVVLLAGRLETRVVLGAVTAADRAPQTASTDRTAGQGRGRPRRRLARRGRR